MSGSTIFCFPTYSFPFLVMSTIEFPSIRMMEGSLLAGKRLISSC